MTEEERTEVGALRKRLACTVEELWLFRRQWRMTADDVQLHKAIEAVMRLEAALRDYAGEGR